MKIAIPSESDTGLESMRSGHFGHACALLHHHYLYGRYGYRKR